MRVLVLDDSGVVPWLVARLAGPEVMVDVVDTFEAALLEVEHRPPDAAVVSLNVARLPWRDLQRACATRHPPVPVLYRSCLGADLEGLGLLPLEGWAHVLPAPASRYETEAALAELLDEARRVRNDVLVLEAEPALRSR